MSESKADKITDDNLEVKIVVDEGSTTKVVPNEEDDEEAATEESNEAQALADAEGD